MTLPRSSSSPLSIPLPSWCSFRPFKILIIAILRRLYELFGVEAGFLAEMGAHEVVGEVMRLAQQPVLGL